MISQALTKTVSAALVGAALALTSITGASASNIDIENHPTDVRFDWNPARNIVTITAFTGCRSAHRGNSIENHLKVYLDHDYLQFDIQGGYLVFTDLDNPPFHIGPADCMGSMQDVVELPIKERETYVVNRHGEHVRDVVLGAKPVSFLIKDTRGRKPKKKGPAMFLKAN